ncbi:hypothetical protein TRFO_36038 [Tritrichomonas foetus]|uniref:Uncharacterized protein n=1 Tax=Tritrichomonas foetus TaxID=1144522 RepID=A0A1J4JEU1_9EUKA|nr:hypothetical protein TRFO_36038 [Tritrichomonas foetus]|eukprot:OHS97710.1 hypothetical protein TRFO_36038 [Tritrichomonas foetus]
MFFFFVCHIFSSFRPFKTIKISSKPARVSMAGFKHFLAVAEISDSINSFPPHLVVYMIGPSSITTMMNVPSPCYSLGTQLVPFQSGFYATAPASAFRWGEPGPLFYRILPPIYRDFRLSDYPRIPYGETFATSFKGNLQILCLPFSINRKPDCLVIEGNSTISLKPPTPVSLFGQAVAASNNGSIIVTVSKESDDNAIVHFFSNHGKLFTSFEIPHSVPITGRSKPPIIQFLDDRTVIAAFTEINKIFLFRLTNNGWAMKQTSEISISSFSQSGQNIMTVDKNGNVLILDRVSFFQRNVAEIPKLLKNSEFTDISTGKDWFAVLEESENKRIIHVYSSKESPLLRGIAIFVVFSVIAFIGILVRANLNVNRVMKNITRRRNTKMV